MPRSASAKELIYKLIKAIKEHNEECRFSSLLDVYSEFMKQANRLKISLENQLESLKDQKATPIAALEDLYIKMQVSYVALFFYVRSYSLGNETLSKKIHAILADETGSNPDFKSRTQPEILTLSISAHFPVECLDVAKYLFGETQHVLENIKIQKSDAVARNMLELLESEKRNLKLKAREITEKEVNTSLASSKNDLSFDRPIESLVFQYMGIEKSKDHKERPDPQKEMENDEQLSEEQIKLKQQEVNKVYSDFWQKRLQRPPRDTLEKWQEEQKQFQKS